MVLKVLTGKIFQTLELRCRLPPVVRFWDKGKARETTFAFTMIGRSQQRFLAGRCAHVKLLKNADYLIDNLDAFILSEVEE